MKLAAMRIVTGAMLLVVPLLAWACGDDGGDDEAAGESDPTVSVIAQNTKFSPAQFTIASGQEVTLALENRDAFEHDLQVDGLDVEVIAGGTIRPEHDGGHGSTGGVLAVHTAANETDAITFMASTPGSYEFYCTIPGHKDSGMVGTLIVQ